MVNVFWIIFTWKKVRFVALIFIFQAEDDVRVSPKSRRLGDVYKGQVLNVGALGAHQQITNILGPVSYPHPTLPTNREV